MDDAASPSPASVAALSACAAAMAGEHAARMRTLTAIAELARTDAVVETGHRNLARLLVEVLRVDPGEARRLLRHAALLVAPDPGPFNASEPALPATAEVAADGGLGSGHVEVIGRTVDRLQQVTPILPSPVVAEAERQLADLARTRSPQQLDDAAHEVLLRLDPDGEVPHDADRPVEELRMHIGRDGVLSGRFRFAEPEAAELLRSAIEARTPAPDPEADTTPLHPGRGLEARRGEALRLLADDAGVADPHPDIVDVPDADLESADETDDGECDQDARESDEPSGACDSLGEIGDDGDGDGGDGARDGEATPATASREDDAETPGADAEPDKRDGPPDDEGPPQRSPARDRPSRETTVLVTVDLELLTGERQPGDHETNASRGWQGFALLDGRHALSPEAARRLACDAAIIPTVMGSRGESLDLGRKTRVVSTAQRRAVIARDRHCAHPGCRRSPRRCDVHHVTPWSQGGATDLQNLVLLCPYHHHQQHHSGWSITMRHGRPHFIPPAWLDPLGTPRTDRGTRGAA